MGWPRSLVSGNKGWEFKGNPCSSRPGTQSWLCEVQAGRAGPQGSLAGPGAPLERRGGRRLRLCLGECHSPPPKVVDTALPRSASLFSISKSSCGPGALIPFLQSAFLRFCGGVLRESVRWRLRTEVVSWLKADTQSRSKAAVATFVTVIGEGGALST